MALSSDHITASHLLFHPSYSGFHNDFREITHRKHRRLLSSSDGVIDNDPGPDLDYIHRLKSGQSKADRSQPQNSDPDPEYIRKVHDHNALSDDSSEPMAQSNAIGTINESPQTVVEEMPDDQNRKEPSPPLSDAVSLQNGDPDPEYVQKQSRSQSPPQTQSLPQSASNVIPIVNDHDLSRNADLDGILEQEMADKMNSANDHHGQHPQSTAHHGHNLIQLYVFIIVNFPVDSRWSLHSVHSLMFGHGIPLHLIPSDVSLYFFGPLCPLQLILSDFIVMHSLFQ